MKRNYGQRIYLNKEKKSIKQGERAYNIRLEKGCRLLIDNDNRSLTIQGLKTDKQRNKIMELITDLFDKKDKEDKKDKSKTIKK